MQRGVDGYRAFSFDLFGTLLEVEHPPDPGSAIAEELEHEGISVPAEWENLFREVHLDVAENEAVSLARHVSAALATQDPDTFNSGVAPESVHRAVRAAFEPTASLRSGANEAVALAAENHPVGVLTNCSVPGLPARAMARSDLQTRHIDGVVTSLACGWRKPHRATFSAIAERLNVRPEQLVHIGDEPSADGGVEAVGGHFMHCTESPLQALETALGQETCSR